MMHFTCDVCGRPVNERRFVVQVEITPAFDPDELTEADLDADNLAEVAALLEHEESTGESILDDAAPKKFRYDLCENCQCRFAKDPLARHQIRQLNFSQN